MGLKTWGNYLKSLRALSAMICTVCYIMLRLRSTRSAHGRARTFENMTDITEDVAQFKSRWLSRKLAMICWRTATADSRED
jgi:hypothetical protein